MSAASDEPPYDGVPRGGESRDRGPVARSRTCRSDSGQSGFRLDISAERIWGSQFQVPHLQEPCVLEPRTRIGLHATPTTKCVGSVYRARYYDPVRSRFVSEDPIGMLGGFQLYAYTGGDPLRFTDPNGLCKIDVRFAQLGPGWYHAYVLTTDLNGSQNYYRGGPSAPGPSGGASGALSSASGGTTSGSLGGRNCGVSNSANSTSPGAGQGGPGADNGPWGSIATSSGPYLPFTIDYDPGMPPSASVLSNDASCGGYNSALAKALGDINKAQIPYNPLSTNSNAVAREIIERAGLSVPSPPVWAPGWSTRLPR